MYHSIIYTDTVLGLCQTSLTDIKSHLDEHWHNNDLLCKICNYTGRDFADMITHRWVSRSNKKY